MNSVFMNDDGVIVSPPVLDMTPGDVPPFFRSSLPINTPNEQQVLAFDIPMSGFPPNSDDLMIIDVGFRFTLYLVWQFSDGTIYTLAKDNWNVVFAADTYVPGRGVTHVRDESGVFADQNYEVTHMIVPKRTGPIANSLLRIVCTFPEQAHMNRV